MEIIIAIVLIAFIGWWFFLRDTELKKSVKPAEEVKQPVEPEKKEPAVTESAPVGLVAIAVATAEPTKVDTVTEAPAKKVRKPRAVKAVSGAKEKAAAKKPAAKKLRSKKV